jgi:hypothetical protein
MHVEEKAADSYGLCLEESDYLEDKSIWIATLSNGLTVYQDDEKSGKEEPIAWKRLAEYCEDNSVKVIGLCLKFRSNVVVVKTPEEIDGFYFAYGAQREFDEDVTRAYYVVGYCKDTYIHSTWYTIPELLKDKESKRKATKKDVEGKRLIINADILD